MKISRPPENARFHCSKTNFRKPIFGINYLSLFIVAMLHHAIRDFFLEILRLRDKINPKHSSLDL